MQQQPFPEEASACTTHRMDGILPSLAGGEAGYNHAKHPHEQR
jgi:hypothetical protein